jgi:hypothetical protein
MARDANVMKSRNSIDDNEQPVALRASRGRERELDKSCRERVTHVSTKRCQRQTGPSAILPPSKQLHCCTQLANDDPSSSQRSASSTNAHDRKPRRGSQLQLTQWRLGRKKGAPTRTPRSSLSPTCSSSVLVLTSAVAVDAGAARRAHYPEPCACACACVAPRPPVKLKTKTPIDRACKRDTGAGDGAATATENTARTCGFNAATSGRRCRHPPIIRDARSNSRWSGSMLISSWKTWHSASTHMTCTKEESSSVCPNARQ